MLAFPSYSSKTSSIIDTICVRGFHPEPALLTYYDGPSIDDLGGGGVLSSGLSIANEQPLAQIPSFIIGTMQKSRLRIIEI